MQRQKKANAGFHVVTGAYGYSGKYITTQLLAAGCSVRTITNSLNRPNPFDLRVSAFPFNFDSPKEFTETLRGADVLYNTYWVRFNHKTFSHAQAVRNTAILFESARKAGVRRVVHVSITNPSLDSPLEYFRGKAQIERILMESGLSYAILRPAVLFGKEDILINNIAWCLRKLPVFGVFGDGGYKLQPIYVDDLAGLAVNQGAGTEDVIINATGPETFTFRGLAETIGEIMGLRRPIVTISDDLGYFFSRLMQQITGDVLLTREEIAGLTGNLLYVDGPAAGKTRLSQWIRDNTSTLGTHYASELARRIERSAAY